jgi:glycosyltransferase involved in cell wall biosynthesis
LDLRFTVKSCLVAEDLSPVDLPSSRIVAIIPAYNEGRFIGSVVLQSRQYCWRVIVVDDGSTDDTARLAELAGAQVIRHEQNSGKGAALNTALDTARALHPQAVVMLDADGQHHPEEILRLVAPILSEEADIVIGSRYLNDSSRPPRHRAWGHRVFNALTRMASGVSTSDSQSGYRAFSARAAEILSFHSQGFSVESEMQFLANQYGLRMAEVPVTIRYLDRPKRNVLLHGVSVLNGVLRLIGQYRPLLFFSILGGALLLAGLLWGWEVVNIYRRVQVLAVGYAMISVLLTILGTLLLATGFILHSIRGLIMDLYEQLRKR